MRIMIEKGGVKVDQGNRKAERIGVSRVLSRLKPLAAGIGGVAVLGYLSLNEIKGPGKDRRQKEFDELVRRLKETGLTNAPLSPAEAKMLVDNFYGRQKAGGGDSYTPAQLSLLTQMSKLTGPAVITEKRHDKAFGKKLRRRRGN